MIMYPYPFRYFRPATTEEALALYSEHEDASYLSGGHTLIPAMKNRLAAPSAVIDLRAIPDLHGISAGDGTIVIGAATPHARVATSSLVREAIPSLALLAGSIADPQVRNVGTIGGSLANNDPAADYPSAVLGLGATVVTSSSRIPADEFFNGLFATSLAPGEIIMRVEFAVPEICGYAKICSQASRYAMAGSFVSRRAQEVRVAITGSGNDGVFRWTEAEHVLATNFSPDAIADLLPDTGAMMSDMHGDAIYRAHLVATVTRLALRNLGAAHFQ